MKSSKRAEVAIIGGSGLERLFGNFTSIRVGTPFGLPPPILIGKVEGREVAFLPRHGAEHSFPPHKVNYRANIYALHSIGVERIMATNAVGAINPRFQPGELVVPHDFIDFTKQRKVTFYDYSPVTHVDFSIPYCPEIRSAFIENAEKSSVKTWDKAVLVCTEGPRFETPAEIEMFRRLGCDIVGMTAVPEAVLARELEMCYATICYISNMAAGLQQKLTAEEVREVSKKVLPVIEQILKGAIRSLPKTRRCPCKDALKTARYKG